MSDRTLLVAAHSVSPPRPDEPLPPPKPYTPHVPPDLPRALPQPLGAHTLLPPPSTPRLSPSPPRLLSSQRTPSPHLGQTYPHPLKNPPRHVPARTYLVATPPSTPPSPCHITCPTGHS